MILNDVVKTKVYCLVTKKLLTKLVSYKDEDEENSEEDEEAPTAQVYYSNR